MSRVPLDRVCIVMMSAVGDAVHVLPVLTNSAAGEIFGKPGVADNYHRVQVMRARFERPALGCG